MLQETADLGPFAQDQGALNRVALAAAALAAAAAGLALVRPIAALGGAEIWAAGRIAVLVGGAAVALAILGSYQALARGERGRDLARGALYLGVAAAAFAFVHAAVADGTIRLDRFGRAYFNSTILSEIWPDLLRGLLVTMRQAVLAEAMAILVGLVVASAQLSRTRWMRAPAVAYVDLVRGLPLLVLAFLVYFGLTFVGLTLSPFVAIIVILTINASAYCAEIFRAGIQSIPRGQTDAALSLGMPYGMTLLFVLIPQAFRAVIPPLVSEFIALIKDTALVNLTVGTTSATADLFSRARTSAASTFSPTPYMLASVFYLAVTVPLARTVGRLEARMRARVA